MLLTSASFAHAQAAGTPPDGPPGRFPLEAVSMPDTVQHIQNIPYADSQNPRQQLDLLLPKKNRQGEPLPLLVAIHGGAFKMGQKSDALRDIQELVASGQFLGASIGYRLSGEAHWPAQIEDCKAAIRWLRAHAADYGIDPNRIGVIGGSAGGHLAAMLGLATADSGLEGTLGKYSGTSSAVQCVVDMFGPTDFLAMGISKDGQDHNAGNSPESELIGAPLAEKPEAARSASPVTYVSGSAPPFLIIHGDADPLVPYTQSVRLYEALRAAGASPIFFTVTDGGHGRFRNPEIGRRIEAFFLRHLHGQTQDIPSTPVPDKAR